MGCGCKDNRKYPHNIKREKKPSVMTREQIQTKEEKILELRGAVREQLQSFKRLTRQ
jgi:hypothetical protein|tara:strand:- start:139 stop:309 length:171 start_codon:yes stop_codon:yes gene_type:complete